MSDATASPEALDAAVAAAQTGAVSPAAPPPSSEPPVPASGDGSEGGSPTIADLVDDDTIDLDNHDLPAATKDEIKKLRREVRGVKDFAKQWQPATQGWAETDLEMLRTALEAGPSNPEAVGEWMLNSAKALLGDKFSELTAAEAATIPDVGEVDEDGKTLTPADVERLVAEKLAERESQTAEEARVQAQIKAIADKSTELGFGPGDPLHFALLSIAKTQTNGNLEEAAELLRERVGGQTSTSTADDSQPGAGGQSQPGAGHTPAATEGGTPAGTKRPSSTRAAAEERISARIGNAFSFPS